MQLYKYNGIIIKYKNIAPKVMNSASQSQGNDWKRDVIELGFKKKGYKYLQYNYWVIE